MKYQTFITLGKATITATGLRCQGQRLKQPDQVCGAQLAKKNKLGQICGNFKCSRCTQIVETQIRILEK